MYAGHPPQHNVCRPPATAQSMPATRHSTMYAGHPSQYIVCRPPATAQCMPATRRSTILDVPTDHVTPETYFKYVHLLRGYLHKVHTIKGQPGVVFASFVPLYGYLPISFTELRKNVGLEIYNKITRTIYCCVVSIPVTSASYMASIHLIRFFFQKGVVYTEGFKRKGRKYDS